MSDQFLLQVEGGRQLRSTLKAAGVDMTEMRKTNLEAAQTVVNAAESTVPRRTGKLANSMRAGATQKAGIARAGGAKVPYANPIHWGWYKHHIRPSLFMVRAAHETEPVWVTQYLARVNQLLDTVKGV